MSKPSFATFLKKSRFNSSLAKKYFDAYDTILKLGLFDNRYYRANYPSVYDSDMDPLVHYLFHGYKENKFPNEYFALETKHDDFDYGGINPLVYYLENPEKNPNVVKNIVQIDKERILSTNLALLNNFVFDEEPLVSIIILNRNGLGHLKLLFEDFDAKTNYHNYEIIVVDNASKDGSINYLESLKEELPITIIKNKVNVSFSKGNNDAAKIANGDYLLLLNNDMEPTYGWLNEMVGTMVNNENVGAVGAKLVFPYYPDTESFSSFSIQHAAVKFEEVSEFYIYGPVHEYFKYPLVFAPEVNQTKECIANTAAAILIPKSLYLDLDGFDENYFYGYEDIDFAFKLYQKGYKNIYCASALLFHHESATRSKSIDDYVKINMKNIGYFLDKWNDFLFESLLRDKIDANKLFTDKNLMFSLVVDENYSKDQIHNLINEISDNNFEFSLISDDAEFVFNHNTDIILCFNPDYDINKAVCRLNTIKVLVLENNNFKNELLDDYDIILTNNESSEEKVFTIEKLDLNEILNIIKEVYLQ